MENNKKLSLDDIFGKPSTTQQPQSKMDLETIFGKKVEPASVAPEGTTIDSMRNISIAPISLPKVELEQQGVIGEDVLQAGRSAFEKEIAADQEPIFPPKQDYAPLNPASIKIGRAMPEVGSVDKPKNLQQTVRSEISKEWGGDLRKFVEDTHKVPAENIQMANDMEAHFWNVMTDKLPKDGFISQEDMDPYSFVRKYDNGDEVTEYSLGHYTYPQEVVNEYIARHNEEVLHEMRFKDDEAYRNDWFLRNVGVTEQVYRDEIADDLEKRLQALRKKIVATLPAQHTRGGYAAIGAAANKPSSGAPVSIEKIDKALKVVNTLRKNNFGAGLKEGFDPADILTLGVSGIGENVTLLNALNKSASGNTLTTTEQTLVDAWDIQNEAEEVMHVLGGRSLASNIGRGGAQSLGFITQTVGTGGLASAATKGITRAAAKSALKRVASTGVASKIKEGVRYGSLKAAESLVGAAARTPFMGFTYRNYTDKRLNQFQVNERVDEATGEMSKYIDKQESSALRDAAHAVLESYFENQSEDVGGLIDLGITSFARALPINQFIRSSVVNGMTGAVKNGAMKWIKESAKIYGLAGKVLSEAYGDAAVNLLTSNTDGWKQMASSEYWWELLGVSSMLSGGFGVVNRAVNSYSGRNLDRQIAHEDNNRRNAISRIGDDVLKKELTEASLTDDLIERSKMLSSLDWSNFSREDMANAVDFIDAQTRLDVMREGATESRRLARIMPVIDEVKKLADGGALDDEQAAANLATIYGDLFRTQENQRTLNILTDRIKVAADAGISADKINDILRGAGLTVFNPGDEIETLTGDRAIVDKVLPGAYEIVNDEGVRTVVSFEEVLQNAPEIRQIQQESQQPVTQSKSAPEINPQVEQAIESARQEAEAIKNLDDDVIYEATLSDGTPVNIIKGANIVYNNQTGEVDYDASDATVVVRSNDGSKRQISIRDIDSIDQAMSVDEALQVATEAAVEVVNSQEQSETPTAEVSSAQAEIPIVQEAEATTAEQTSESTANQPEQQVQIPTLKNGDPDYNAMDARMFAEQYVTRFGEGATERIARNNIKASNKTISTIEKQIEDVTDPNKMPALYSKLQDAQATKDKYVAVLEELGLSSDESEDNAARVQRKKQENTSWFNRLFPDGFPNVESVILWDIANGNRIRWANKEVNGAVVSKGLGSELGLADSNAERTRRIALIGKDAPTPEEYAEQLPERLKAMGVRFEEGELRDKVLDVYASVDTVRKAKEELERMSANIQAEQEGLDYEEEQMRRNYEREQESLRQEAQPKVGAEQTEQEQLTNEEAQEEELSIEDEVPFMVSSDSVQATTEAHKLATEAAITALEDAGVQVEKATPEMVEEALRQRDVQLQAVEDRLIALKKAEKFVVESLQGKKRNKSFRLTLPDSTLRKIRALIGRDFDSHNLDGNSFVHSKRLHGINGEKINANSIPLSDKDFALAPYIMIAPDRVSRGSVDAIGRESIRFEKTLSNGVVVVVEKEQKNSPTDMDTITMWADLSGSVMHGQSPASTIVRDVIATMDDAKIRKDAENAIRQDVQMHIEQQNSIDDAYMNAVKAGDMELAKKLVREYAESRGYYLFGDFRDAHAAPSSSVDKRDFTNAEKINQQSLDEGWDVNLFAMPQGENLAPNDFWSPMGPRWYMYDNTAGRETHAAINSAIRSIMSQLREYGEVRNMPTVTVYRAVPNSIVVEYLQNGDWVTPSITYATNHGLARFGEGEFRIIEQDVPATDLWWDGNDAREWGYDNGNVEAYANTKNNIKMLEPITRDDNGNIIPLSLRFDSENPDSRFQIISAPVFVSNAKIAVLGIKQEKATPEQWLKMIEKAGGLKAGEDKWIGLSDWLKASDKKTLTKQEVLDYINENQIQIEEVEYGDGIFSRNSKINLESELQAALENGRSIESALSRWDNEFGDNKLALYERGFFTVDEKGKIHTDEPVLNHINSTRLNYTTYGLENKREIALVVPTIESWNASDQVHFGDAGNGRAIAWVRFGETTALTDEAIAAKKAVEDYLASMRKKYGSKEGEETDAMTADEIDHLQSLTAKEIESREKGLRVLVIDEIQSKRHQEGRERGYKVDISGEQVAKALEDAGVAHRILESFDEQMAQKYGTRYWTDQGTNEEYAHWELLRSEANRYEAIFHDLYDRNRKGVPEAPFEKNWAELAMKRMLRYAAENGYDAIAWTKGEQQAERYNIGSIVDKIVSYTEDGAKTVRIYIKNNEPLNLKVDSEGKILYSNRLTVSAGQNLSDVVGKDVAVKILRGDGEDATIYAGKGKEYAAKQLSGNGLRIGGEGMRAFYDQMLPSFMRKYGKKWGATVQDVTLPYVEEAGRTMHSVDITDSMRESVMQGQPMFYRRPNGTVYGWTNGTTVYLTESGMNPNTPIHEYTHIWSDAMRKHNPEGWASIVKLLKGTPVWNEVMADTNYANIHGDENKVASEALSRISGRENSDKMEAMAQHMIDENANDTVKKNRARKLLDRMRKALQEFWSWVGKELFGIKNFERIEQVTDRILYDLVSGTDLNPVSSFDTSAAERAEIIRASKASETYLKAPNGKDTNLTPEQWVTVRTKTFKRWFGDWENGGESSQVLDVNGEPLVVWHGGEFATDEFVANGSMHFGTKVAALQRILDNAWGYGNWTVGRNSEGRWSWKYTDPDDTGHDKQGETAFALPIDALVDAARIAAPKAVVRPYFLNIRNLERTEDQNSDWVDAVSFSMDAGYDGIIYRNDFEDEGEDSYVAFYPNQIKLADGNTTFDPSDDDVRFSIGKNNERKEDFSFVEYKVTPLARLEAERDALLENRENNPNFEQEYAAIEERIREESETDRVALTVADGLESEVHRIAVEDAVFDYVRENNLFASQVYVVNSYEAFIEKIKELFTGADISSLDPNVRAIYRDGMIVIRADAIDTRVTGIAKLMHEYTHALTVEELNDKSYYRRMLQIAKVVGAPYMVARLEGYEDLGIDKSDNGLVDGLMELLARDMEFVVRNGRLDEFLASEDASEVVLREYFEKYDVPQPLTELLIEIATEIRSIKYGKINLNQKGYRATQSSLLRTSRGNDGANLSSDARDYERGGVFRRSRTHESTEGSPADSGGEVGEGSRGYRADLANSQEQSASDQENKLTPQEDKAKDKTLKQLDRLNKVINSLRQTVKQAERDNVDLANIVQAALEEEVKDGGINRFLDVPELISLIRSGMDKKSIESTMDRLSERLTDAIIKNREEQLAKLLQVQVQGTNAFGIPIGYAVDDETRAMVEFFRENLSRDMKKIVETMENADEKFLQPYNKSELNVWFTAYKEIEESRYNIKATQKDIDHETERSQSFYRLAKELKAKNASESQIKTAQEHRRQALSNKKAQKKAILVAKQTLAQELEGMIFLLGGRLRDGRAIRAGRLSADKVYAKNFLTEAMADVRVNDGTKTYQGTKEQLEAKAKFHKDIRVRTSAYRSYAYMIQSVSRNAIGGKGFLWDALMEGKNGWVDCNDKRLAMDNIDNQEILANVQASGLKSVADLQRLFDQQLVDKNGNPYVFRYETDRTGRIDQDIRPTIGWATYIVLCFEQDDMAPTMEKMRITEEQVQQIRDMLPEAAKEFLKWSREMLSDRRQRIYNPASLERFGTQMANIPNYFPIRRLEKNLHRVEEVEQVASADSDQVTIMANALIKRVRNVVEIDFQQNPLELLKKHLERMNGFAANVPLARNVNILLNSSGFRDQLNEQGDPNTYEYFKAAAKVALSSYKPKSGALDSVMIELQGWLAAGKIAWRFFTALKQLLSIPAFWTYNISPRYKVIFIRSVLWPAVKNGDEGKLVAIWKWGMDNIPQLKERWSSRYAGNEKLAQVKETLTAQFIAKRALLRNSVGKIGEWGMIPNAAVDLFACSIGCYAVYKFELEQLQKKGYSKEEADELAKRRASIAFNESQQSSEAAFIAPLQRDRTFLAVQVSLFNNSNFGYGRKEKLARKYLWQQTFNKDLREKRLALAKRRYLERFLNEERNRLVENNNKIADVAQRLRPEEIDRMVESKRAEFSKRAEKEANRDAEMSYAKGVEDVVMFKWLLNMAWAMAPTAVSYWLSCAIRQGDDEDPENPLSAETLALMFATATFRNAIGGGLLESGLNGYGFTGLVGSEVEKTVDILAQALQPLWLTDEEVESFDPLAVWMAVKQCLVMGTGFDVNVYANILTGLVGLFNDRSRTTADVLRILNAPKSMIREIEIIPFEDETLDNYTRRMAMMENVALDRMEELKGIPSSELNASELKVLRKKKKWEKNLITIRQAEAADVPYGREVDGRVVAPGLKQLDADYTDLLKSLDLTQSGKNRAGKVEFTEDERRRKKALRVVTRVKGIHNMEESAIEVINNPEAYKKEYRQIVEEKRKLIEDWNK